MLNFNEWFSLYMKSHPNTHLLSTRSKCAAAYAAGMRDVADHIEENLDGSLQDWIVFADNIKSIAEMIENYGNK